jgi:crotonobetainyl-CoA:carnitine CoA-transferase CaiB-like acyl-CoA transferase
LLGEIISQRSTLDWLVLLQSLDIPAAPLRTPAELFDDPHLNAVGLFETVQTQWGPVRFPGVPTWFSRTPGRVTGGPPELGEHTAEILQEIAK